MDIFTLSKILGHSSVEVTEQAYLDLTDEDIYKQYAKASPLGDFWILFFKNLTTEQQERRKIPSKILRLFNNF